MTRLNVDGARCEALFASELRRSDVPTAGSVTEAISRTVRRLGTRGCAGRMVQELGGHPQAAAERMRWIRQLAAGTNPADGEPRPGAAWPVPGLAAPGHDSPRDGGAEMNQTCDRSGPAVRAVYRVDRCGELYLGRHCTNQLWAALSAQGWTIWPAREHALAPQASEYSGAS